jgi:hypothetical protein
MMISPLLVFVPAALFHCANKNGRRAAWAAFVVASLLAGLLVLQGTMAKPDAAHMTYAWFAAVVLSIALPAVLALPLVEKRQSFGKVVTFALAGGAIGLGVTEIVMRAVANFSPHALQVEKFHQEKGAAIQIYRTANLGPEAISAAEQVASWITAIIPALLLTQFAVVFVLSLMMFGRISAWRTFTSAGPDAAKSEARPYLFRNFALPEWLLFGFVFGGLTPLTSGTLQKIAANVLALIVFLFLLQGLAIFRAMIASSGVGILGATFAIFVLVMLSLTLIGLLVLVVAGLFDPFFDFRKLKRKDDSHESHTD